MASVEKLTRDLDDAIVLLDLGAAENDDATIAETAAQVPSLEARVRKAELERMLAGPVDHANAIVSIHPGTGGNDAKDWAQMLLRMYLLWAEEHRMPVEFLEESVGDEAGIKSATIRVSGARAYGLLKGEHGVHRLVRISPFDAAHRRHTSFVLVEVTPEIEDTVTVDVDPDDVRTDVFRSSGAGGQHVNKTSSAVRLTHIPTGVVVTCQNERSQQQNRDVAWRVLRSRLLALQQAAHAQKVADLKGELIAAEWGSQIRSYVLQPYTMVKDHRTSVEVGNAQGVLDGDIDPFIEGYLHWAAREGAES